MRRRVRVRRHTRAASGSILPEAAHPSGPVRRLDAGNHDQKLQQKEGFVSPHKPIA
jgi:hypothetical protein